MNDMEELRLEREALEKEHANLKINQNLFKIISKICKTFEKKLQ